MRKFRFIGLLLSVVVLSSCAAPSVARFDYPRGGELYWPGPPEKPRIKYLYSITRLSGSEESSLQQVMEGVLGEEEVEVTQAPTFLRPYGVWVSSGRLYVTDTAATRLSIIDLRTARVQHLGIEEPAKLLAPVGVIADSQGKIWVTDSLAGQIWLFDPSGRPLGFLGEKEGLERPTGIAFHKTLGRVYVADTGQHSIFAFDSAGRVLFKFGQRGEGEGEFNYPTHLTVDGQGNLLVVDSMNFRVQVLDPSGKFLYQWGTMGKGWGAFSRPKGVATDSKGHIYLVEADMDGVQIFDSQGKLLLYFGQTGQGIGQFWLPGGIAIDEQDRIYIADTYNNRIQVLQYLGEN